MKFSARKERKVRDPLTISDQNAGYLIEIRFPKNESDFREEMRKNAEFRIKESPRGKSGRVSSEGDFEHRRSGWG